MLAISVVLEHEVESLAPLRLIHHAILIKCGRLGQDASERCAVFLLEVRQLLVRILVHVTALHQVLAELHDGHEVAARDLLVAATHLHLLHEEHGQVLEQVEVRRNEPEHLLDPLTILLIVKGRVLEHAIHVRDEQTK